MKKFFYTLLIIFCVFMIDACAPQLVMLSPEDHYALGNYYLDSEEYAKAKNQFQKIRNDYPASQFATMSQFKLAQTQFHRERFSEASIDFELFLEFHPAHKLAPYAKYHLALSKYYDKLSPDRDPTLAHEALIEFNEFIAQYPDHPNIDNAIKLKIKLEDHLAMHEFQAGMVYYRRQVFHSAIDRFESITHLIHDADFKANVLFMIGKCKQLQREDKDIDASPSFESIRSFYQQAIESSPNSKWAKKANRHLDDING